MAQYTIKFISLVDTGQNYLLNIDIQFPNVANRLTISVPYNSSPLLTQDDYITYLMPYITAAIQAEFGPMSLVSVVAGVVRTITI